MEKETEKKPKKKAKPRDNSIAKTCCIKDCKRPYRAKGYCNVHYALWRHGAYGHKRYKVCGTETCKKPMKQEGLCETHWNAKRGKTPVAVAPTAEVAQA